MVIRDNIREKNDLYEASEDVLKVPVYFIPK